MDSALEGTPLGQPICRLDQPWSALEPLVAGPPSTGWSGAITTNGDDVLFYITGGAELWRWDTTSRSWTQVLHTTPGSTDEMYPIYFTDARRLRWRGWKYRCPPAGDARCRSDLGTSGDGIVQGVGIWCCPAHSGALGGGSATRLQHGLPGFRFDHRSMAGRAPGYPTVSLPSGVPPGR